MNIEERAMDRHQEMEVRNIWGEVIWYGSLKKIGKTQEGIEVQGFSNDGHSDSLSIMT